MEVTLVIEHRFFKDKNGRVFSSSNSVNTLLWERYLKVFKKLNVIARIKNTNREIDKEYLVSHNKVKFTSVPYYVGPKQFVKNYFKIKKVLDFEVKTNRAYIFRLPSVLGTIMIKKLKKKKIPYVVELVGDPWDVFAPKSLKNSISLLHRYRSYYTLKRNVYNASAVIYVTEKMLQKRYVAAETASTTHASNVVIFKNNIAKHAKKYTKKLKKLNIISIGSLEQMYKSPDVVLKALKIVEKEGVDFEFFWLGEGVFKKNMETLSKKLNISKKVKFVGNIVSKQVIHKLQEADLYIHASRTEGLPRSLIEAMAQGLPCIGTRVGGIPELLSYECLIEKNDVPELAKKILYFYENPEIMEKFAEINLKKANEYEYNILEERRNKIYSYLKKIVR